MSPAPVTNKPCSQCQSLLSTGAKFCSECGIPVLISPFLEAGSRERRMLENDVTEIVAERIIKWFKIASAVVCTAMAVVLGELAFWGYTTVGGVKKGLEDKSSELSRAIDEQGKRTRLEAKEFEQNIHSSSEPSVPRSVRRLPARHLM